ncbi:MAG: hypothetical protein O7G86_05075, partial [Gammaproteobacteria bacterium]|nr:hypothetical protein [Gammaproteobacteria bacterium]
MDSNEITELHRSLLEKIRCNKWGFFGVTPIVPPPLKMGRAADDPSKSYITDESGRRIGVLILSNTVNTHLVARSVARAREAKLALSDRLGSVVLEPIVDADFSGQSFAIWPLQRDLSSSRLLRHLQKRVVRRKVLRWLEAATRHTM